MPLGHSLGLINAPPCLLIAYFELCDVVLQVIVDTGASVSCLPELGVLMKSKRFPIKKANLNAIMADNYVVNIDKRVTIPVRPRGETRPPEMVNFYITNGQEKLLGYDAIIGLDSLRLFDIQIRFDCKEAKLYLREICIGSEMPVGGIYTASIKVDDRFDRLEVDDQIKPFLKRYKAVFTDVGPEPIYGRPMRFITVHQRPIFAKTRNYSKDEIMEMKDRVDALLKSGVIEPTRSGYAATSRIVPKKSGPGRLVVNYIPLNAVTLRDSYSIPHVSDITNVLTGMKYFSTMDCAQGFYQILVDPRDRHKTAFSTPVGNFQYIRCPFGARNSCAVFQAEMNRIFREGLYTRCAIYVDDILVFGHDREEHDANLQWVLDRAKQYNVKIKLEKCHFAKTEVDYLGFRISGSSIKPLPNKKDSLCRSKPPRDKTGLRSLIGKLNFYARFIPCYSRQLEPLRELFRKNSDFQWQDRHQKAYEDIIESLNSATHHILVDNSTIKIIELYIVQDSLEAVCLTEKEELICRSSRLLSAAEGNYSLVEKQLLALVMAMKRFRFWLQPDKFVVRLPTNGLEKALKLVNKPERVDNQLLRMPAGFDTFKFEIKPSLQATISKQLEYHLPQEVYYVDGACKRNGKPDCVASWAVCAEYDESIEVTGFVTDSPSNNAAELTAAIKACEIAKEKNQTEITIVTDSKYLHSAVTLWIDKWNINDFQDCKRKQVVNTKLFKELSAAKHGLKVEWIHVRGHADTPGNIRADMLARSLLDDDSAAICSISIGNRDIQGQDLEVEDLRMRIREGKAPEFVEDNGCVYRIDPKVEYGDPKQIYVPKASVPYLLGLAHDNQIYGGHLGIKKTFGKLSRFWWPGKHKDVETYVKTCESCQMFKRQSGLPYGHLHSIPVSTVFENLHLDMIGPVTTSTDGNKYIITATDAFSKWAFARPCKNIVTSEVIRFIEEAIISIHGEPKNIITDRGVQFRSKEWTSFIARTGIKHNMTSGYHPQANGIDERFNGTLIRILLAYVDENQEQWDRQVKWAVYLYNTTVHDSTGFTPYHVMYGLSPRSPLNAHPTSYNLDRNQHDAVRSQIRNDTAEQIRQAQSKQTDDYNKRHSRVNLQIGELVWVKEHTCPSELSKKMFPKYYGPCVIIGIMGEADDPRAISIFDPVLLKKKVVSLQDIKRYEERPEYLRQGKEHSKEKGDAQDNSSCTGDLIDLRETSSCPFTAVSDISSTISTMKEDNQELSDQLVGPNTSRTQHDTFQPIGLHNNDTGMPLTSSPRRVTISNDVHVNFFDKDSTSIHSHDCGNESAPSQESSQPTVIENEYREVSERQSEQDSSRTLNQDPSETNMSTPRRSRISPYVMDFIVDDSVRDPTYAPRKVAMRGLENASRPDKGEVRAKMPIQSTNSCSSKGNIQANSQIHRYNLRSRAKTGSTMPSNTDEVSSHEGRATNENRQDQADLPTDKRDTTTTETTDSANEETLIDLES